MSLLKLLPDEEPCPDCTEGGQKIRWECSTCGGEGVVPVDDDEAEQGGMSHISPAELSHNQGHQQ